MKNKKIGISIFVMADGKFGLFENGLRQNVIFLYHLFKAIPNYKVYLLNYGDADPSESLEMYGVDDMDIVRAENIQDELDYVISIGAAIDGKTIKDLRKGGTKIICYKGGNAAVISMEAVASIPIRHDAERYFDVDYYDAIWMTPQHLNTYKSWAETLFRCPVYEVPQIWSPLFINGRSESVRSRYMYEPGSKAKRVVVMEPNITVMKTAHFPILVSEVAYQKAPNLFNSLYVCNSIQLSKDEHFSSFCNSLSIFKDGIATVEPRFIGPDFIADHADAIVVHHWENGLNYLYYEALYGGYPLIHNSEFIKNYGYYYPSFDAQVGGEILTQALKSHDANLGRYISESKALLAKRDPCSKFSIDSHLALLELLH